LLEILGRGRHHANQLPVDVARKQPLLFIAQGNIAEKVVAHRVFSGPAACDGGSTVFAGAAGVSAWKYLNQVSIGLGAEEPNRQIDVAVIASASCRTSSRVASGSASEAGAAATASAISTSFWLPIRHGTHLPHDSLLKKRLQLSACSSMSRPSPYTTMPA